LEIELLIALMGNITSLIIALLPYIKKGKNEMSDRNKKYAKKRSRIRLIALVIFISTGVYIIVQSNSPTPNQISNSIGNNLGSHIAGNNSSLNRSQDEENQAPKITDLKPFKPDPQYAGESVRWEAAAYDPENDELLYKFLVNGEDETGWTKEKTWTWETVTDCIGDNQIDVWIRDGKHTDTNNFDDHKSVKFTIEEPPKEPVRLSSLRAVSTFTGINYDSDARMKFRGEEYAYGVQLYACSKKQSPNEYIAEFDLDGEYSHLTGRIGFDDIGNNTGAATIYFRNDNDEPLVEITIKRGDPLSEVNIDVSEVNKLRITSQTTTPPHCKYIDLIDMKLDF